MTFLFVCPNYLFIQSIVVLAARSPCIPRERRFPFQLLLAFSLGRCVKTGLTAFSPLFPALNNFSFHCRTDSFNLCFAFGPWRHDMGIDFPFWSPRSFLFFTFLYFFRLRPRGFSDKSVPLSLSLFLSFCGESMTFFYGPISFIFPFVFRPQNVLDPPS